MIHFCCYRFCSRSPIGLITYNSIFFLLFFSVVYFGVNCILHCVFSMKIEFITSFTADRIGCCINDLKYSSVNKITVNQHLYCCCRANNCMHNGHYYVFSLNACVRCFFPVIRFWFFVRVILLFLIGTSVRQNLCAYAKQHSIFHLGSCRFRFLVRLFGWCIHWYRSCATWLNIHQING